MIFDLSLYLVTDIELCQNRSIEWVVEEAAKGGVTMVQLREKNTSTREFYETGIKIKKILQKYKIPLIVNDRLDIAMAIDAEGLHIGQSDIPYEVARQLLGKDKIIGLSVENIDQVIWANTLDVDYIGISPVFHTTTKNDIKKPFGLEGIRRVKEITVHQTVGIGGINSENASSVIESGADGIAVVSSIVSARDPLAAAQNLISKIRQL